MADLKRKLNILQHLSPAISEKQPRTQTKCGGLLMMTLFPIAVVIYSLVWFNSWYVSDAGALQIVEWKQFGDNGVPLDGGSDMRQTVKDQTLTCLASSGCWFTVYEYSAEGRTCPSGAEIAKQQQNAALMGQKVTSPIDADVWSMAPEKPAKGCAWVPKGKPLTGACLFQTLDPIDTFTVFWKYDASAPSSAKEKFGVALTTTNVSTPDRGQVSSGRGFFSPNRWRTDGGGAGYTQRPVTTGLHFGEMQLQVLHRNYEYMTDAEGNDAPQATELVPIYSHTADTAAEAGGACVVYPGDEPSSAFDVSAEGTPPAVEKCSDTSCRQLKIRPMPLAMYEARAVVSPASVWIAAIGGMTGLFIFAISCLHSAMLRTPLGKLSLCVGATHELHQAIGQMRSESPSKVGVQMERTPL